MVKNKSLSITMAELNRQLSTAFALMTILPMAALSYFIITYIVPNIVTRENIFLVFFISMVLSLCGFSILKRIVGSILKLEEYVKAIAKGDITQKIDFRNSREIGNIGKALNTILQKMQDYQEELKRLNKNLDKMVKQRTAELETSYKELKDTESMLIQSEKMAAVGQLASGIAHEVKNPLAVITQGIAYLEKTAIPDKERWAEILNMINDAINRSDKIIRGLLGFARPSPLQLQPRSIEEVIDSALGLIRQQLIQNKIELSEQIAPNLPLVIIDDNQIVQVFVNLILNSMNAMPDGGKITINIYARELTKLRPHVGRRAADYFKLGDAALFCEVIDTGRGIDEGDATKIFDPFYTSRSPEGTGLGLTITKSILEAHKGILDIESQKDKGTKATIILPLA